MATRGMTKRSNLVILTSEIGQSQRLQLAGCPISIELAVTSKAKLPSVYNTYHGLLRSHVPVFLTLVQ